jgi:NADPH:quinone reductase-like Zn-dependent oxidoreductase
VALLQVYATVGTDAKRAFLTEGYGIPDHHIFSSRSTDFAAQLMSATSGRGVDVVLNSLTGDMLHESWRCIAENGIFLEIGKRDLVDRSSLSMEPFNRNASYRAVDMSRKGMPANVIFM